MKIIIADDHSVVRRGIKYLLMSHYPHAYIEEAEDGTVFLEKLEKQTYDLAICDISMPDMNGIELLKIVKLRYSNLPVIIMSIFPESQFAVKAIKNGADAYLCKDSIHEHLVTAVNFLLSGKKYFTPVVLEEISNNREKCNELPIEKMLSKRELDVFKGIIDGKSTTAIAGQLSLGKTTISTFRKRILNKLQTNSNAGLIFYAYDKKLVKKLEIPCLVSKNALSNQF